MTKPWVTPDETRMRCTATLGTAALDEMIEPITPPMLPPGTPPGTPPTTPMDGGGASSSLIISTFFGILVGVRSCPFTMSVCTVLTMWTSAGGGGGGGGGGGATRNVIVSPLGSASVNSSGIRTMTPMIAAFTPKEKSVVTPRL